MNKVPHIPAGGVLAGVVAVVAGARVDPDMASGGEAAKETMFTIILQ